MLAKRLTASLLRGGSDCGAVQLEQIMDGADHRPLASDLRDTAEEELSEASDVLDVPEYWLHDLLSQPVSASAPGPADRLGHGLHTRLALEHAPRHGIGLAMPDAARRQVSSDPAFGQGVEVGFGGEPRVARHFAQLAAQLCAGLVHQRDQACEVAPRAAEPGSR